MYYVNILHNFCSMNQVNINFGNSRFHSNVVRVSTPAPTSKEKHAFLTGLQTLFPQAAVLSRVFPKEDRSSSVTARTLPATLTSLYNTSCSNMDESDLQHMQPPSLVPRPFFTGEGKNGLGTTVRACVGYSQ